MEVSDILDAPKVTRGNLWDNYRITKISTVAVFVFIVINIILTTQVYPLKADSNLLLDIWHYSFTITIPLIVAIPLTLIGVLFPIEGISFFQRYVHYFFHSFFLGLELLALYYIGVLSGW